MRANFAEKERALVQDSSKVNSVTPVSKSSLILLSTFLTYERYKDLMLSIVAELGLNPEHKPHDGRAQFATMAKKYNMDEYAIKRIMGHSIKDLTERVYTTRGVEWLKEEVEKIGKN